MAMKRKRPDPKAGKRKQLAKPAARSIAKPEPAKPNSLVLTQEHVDRLQKHPDMFNHSIGRLMEVMRRSDEHLPGKDAQDFAYEAFIGFIPDGPGEIMLCQQMIAAYEMSMVMLARSKRADNLSLMQECGLLGIKMMGAYERLFQTLMKTRRPQQTVRVEHVHVYEGGQAVVGNVNQRPAIPESQAASQVAAESAAMRVIEGNT